MNKGLKMSGNAFSLVLHLMETQRNIINRGMTCREFREYNLSCQLGNKGRNPGKMALLQSHNNDK